MRQSPGTMRLFRVWLVLAGVTFGALGQTNSVEVRKITLTDCIEIALQHNFDVQIQRYNPQLARYAVNVAYGSYDPNFSISGEHDAMTIPGGVDAQGRIYSGVDSQTDKFSSGLQGLLPWGLNYSVGASVADQWGTKPGVTSDPNQPIIVTNTFYDVTAAADRSFLSTNYATIPSRFAFENASGSVGFLQLRQPLLKNLWIDSTRLQIILNKKSLEASEQALRAQIMNSITDVEKAYYNVIFAQDNIKVQQKALELAERLVAENRKRVEVGALAPLDEKQAESQAAQSRADLLAVEGTEGTQQRVLKSLLSDDYSKWEKVSIQPAEALVAVSQDLNLQESWRKGLTLRPDLVQQKISLEKQGIIIKYQKNQLLPQLDVIGTYGFNASSGGYGGTFDQLGNGSYPFWSVGGQMTIPLTQTSARNNYKSAKVTKEQIVLQLKQLEQGILIQIENAMAVARTSYQQVNATREARIYAEAALDAEQKKLESGKSTSFVVLQLQKNLTSASSSELRALADYNIARAQLALNEGSTLDHRRVTLQVK